METATVPEPFNSEKEISLRKYMQELSAAGEAIIIFGAWTSLKVLLTTLVNDNPITDYIDPNLDLSTRTQFIVLLLVYTVISFAAMVIHLFAGIGAMREGRGKKKGNLYLFVSALLAAMSLLSLSGYLHSIITHTNQDSLLTLIVSIMFEIAILVIVFDIFRSAIKVRSLKKALQKEAADEQ